MKRELWDEAVALFERALELPAAERGPFVEAACADNADLRERVLAMLRADASTASLLDASPADLAATLATNVDIQLVGRRIGVYIILDVIGRGGMGTVCLARREDVGKQVALKLVAGGLASPDRIARFLQERRLLAQLDHPNIAQLLDAGVMEDGTPWLAMEYVPGQTIDEYCTSQKLTVEQRLRIFERVCQAVAYAHRHLIVHRDLKPSNILVAADGEPRLLDFGIAKLLDSDDPQDALTATMFRPMTPQYASPEQMRGEVITTASDVYQLGALLFELLTGRKPRPQKSDPAATMQAEVPRPSRVVEGKLARRLRGELDNIVLKATHSDAQQRYSNAEQLADDVRRFCEGQPVQARPSTAAYRVKKFVLRHRAGTATATLAVLGLLTFAFAMAWQARRISVQQVRAEQVSSLLVELLAGADPTVAQGDTITVAAVLQRGAQRVQTDTTLVPEVRGRLLTVIAWAFRNLGQHERARMLQSEAVTALRTQPEDDSLRIDATMRLGSWLSTDGPRDSARRVLDEALLLARQLPARRRTELAVVLSADALWQQVGGNYDAARAGYQNALALYRSAPDSVGPGIEEVLANLAFMITDAGRVVELRREVLARRRTRLGPNNSLTAKSMVDLSSALVDARELEEAERLILEAVTVMRRVFSGPNDDVVGSLHQAARVLAARGKYADAEAKQREAMAMSRTLYGSDDNALAVANLAGYVERQQRLQEAAHLHRQAVRLYTAMSPNHLNTAIVITNLAYNAFLRRDLVEADSLYRRALPVLDSAWRGTTNTHLALNNYASVLAAAGRCADAEPHLRRVVAMPLQDKPPDFFPVLRAQRQLGNCLVQLRRYSEAEPLLLEAHEKLLQGWGAQNPFTQTVQRELQTLYERWGKPEQASRYRSPN